MTKRTNSQPAPTDTVKVTMEQLPDEDNAGEQRRGIEGGNANPTCETCGALLNEAHKHKLADGTIED